MAIRIASGKICAHSLSRRNRFNLAVDVLITAKRRVR